MNRYILDLVTCFDNRGYDTKVRLIFEFEYV